MMKVMISNDLEYVMNSEEKSLHVPVLCKEVVEFLNPHPQSRLIDFTAGLGGHALALLKAMGPQGHLVAVDRDKGSLDVARENLKEYIHQCEFVHDDYRNIDRIFEQVSVKEVDGMLLDLGISSYQLDNPERGFSFNANGPLDMRMDQGSFISAFDLVNTLSEKEIASILKNFGEERWHNRIAHFLIEERSRKPISSTRDLRDAILRAIPARFKQQRIHPATRTFQAIRIAVNRELEALDIILDKCINYLSTGGRICVISFHSLEDRIVKQKFKRMMQEGKFKLLTKKPIEPGEEDVFLNPRARSAKMRVAERVS